IFFGAGFQKLLAEAKTQVETNKNATVFGYYVDDPERYGVASFDEDGKVLSIEEKPKKPKSNYAVVGLYFYPNSVIEVAKSVQPSSRGELEITSVNAHFLSENQLKMQIMSRGYAWLDTGTHEALTEATEFVKTIEKRTGLKIGCIEEIAFRKGFIDAKQLSNLAKSLNKSSYGKYLSNLLK